VTRLLTTDTCDFVEAEQTYLSASRGELWALQEFPYWNYRVTLNETQGWKRNTGMTQNQKIMKHLRKAGSITVREAMVEYSIQSLTKRINELREAGHNIVSNTKYHPITRQKYVRYSLAD